MGGRARRQFQFSVGFDPLSCLLRTRRPDFAPLLAPIFSCASLHPDQPQRLATPLPHPPHPLPLPTGRRLLEVSPPLDDDLRANITGTPPQAPRHSLSLREPGRPKPLQRRRLQRDQKEWRRRLQQRGQRQRWRRQRLEVTLHTPAEQST